MVNKRLYILLVLLAVFAALAFLSTFIYTDKCETFNCFQQAMRECSRKSYVNDAPDATWKYAIKGSDRSQCVVEVRLLQLKEGDISFERLRGFSMECAYPEGVAAYPERNLDKCHGRLKEELQTIIIKKLHAYIVNNIGEIEEGLKVFSG